ncbi:hypothetical protein GCM10007874_51390 [Labrys miyagiensis]|uniref:Response regulatory domain-containing protein n=1 Tax=Labrys miyagiensis TaxID=346912 RepID=A0ABQ6CV27_9HYPH|nr:response regulator [Labrys miyagiensis]GLS22122.1 hypothetical protein GCM10007874_51390 [Labrys miyagiensis]
MVPQSEPQHKRPSILVVEDEALIRAILSDELRTAGLTVVEATSADEALSYLKTAGMVDLIFTDIQMPGSMNGLELARRLRAQNPSLPIIITSGNTGPKGAEGIGQFMPKPYDMEQAVEMICSTLGVSPSGGRT